MKYSNGFRLTESYSVLHKTYSNFYFMKLLLGLIFLLLPVNGLPFSGLGLIGKQAAFYPTLVFVVIIVIYLFISRSSVYLNKHLLAMVVILLLWIIVVGAFNFTSIYDANHLGRRGGWRFIEQFLQLLFGLVLMMALSVVINCERRFITLCRYLNICLWLVLIFGVIQFFGYFFRGPLLDGFLALENVIYEKGAISFVDQRGEFRVHSFSQEPSLLIGYLALVGPMVLSYNFRNKRYLLLAAIWLVIFMSGSRTGVVILFIQSSLLLVFFKYGRLSLGKFIKVTPFIGVTLLLLIVTPFYEILMSLTILEGSNMSRFAGVFVALQVWLDHNPLTGIGLGQFGFYAMDYIPAWARVSEMRVVQDGGQWAYTHNILATLLVEIGLIGVSIFLALFGFCLLWLHQFLSKDEYQLDDDLRWIVYGGYVSIVGTALTFFSRETLGNLYIWITLGFGYGIVAMCRRNKRLGQEK